VFGRRRRQEIARRQAAVASVERWFHSIDLGHGVVTPGETPPEAHAGLLALMRWPDLRGKTVLDIGAYDGFYSFEAERRGAARVVALDHYMWSFDVADVYRYWDRCRQEGVVPRPYHEVPELWRPDELPGRRGFDTAHEILGSSVEAIVGDFTTMDLDALGTFDVVLYLGVLYHMEDPVGALRRVARVTRQQAIVETEAIHVAEHADRPLWEFFPTNELNHDVSNWWAPNLAALLGLCSSAGFVNAEVLGGPPTASSGLHRYRATVRALK
jgi:tRNA (mo5U34)-methyltransferase